MVAITFNTRLYLTLIECLEKIGEVMNTPDFMIVGGKPQVTFSGFLTAKESSNFTHFFVQEPTTKYLVDINNRMDELVFNYGRKVTAALYVSNDVASIDDIITTVLAEMDGDVSIEYEAYERRWSEYTAEMTYDSSFKIGGHDFQKILASCSDKYVILVFQFTQ